MTRLGLIVALLAIACGSDNVRRAAEEVQVVGGTPTVTPGLPGVERGDGGLDASFGPAAPFQVDSFDQPLPSKVDILWVVDNSSSMQAKQDRLKANINSFVQFLQAQQVDYHLGVVSTDTFDPRQSGKLQNGAGLAQPWINSDAGTSATGWFIQDVGLGELGSGDEKGLLGAMLALTPPLSPSISSANPDAGASNCTRLPNGNVDCFVRPGAALYTIIISDEEDSSCNPLQTSGLMSGEGCTDSDIQTSHGYGSTDYWSRFFSGAKDGGVSRIATIVATDSTTRNCSDEFARFCDAAIAKCASNTLDCHTNVSGTCCSQIYQCDRDLFTKAQRCHVQPSPATGATRGYTLTGQWNGCKSQASDGGVDFTAIHAPRYTAVAQGTGGIASSICDQDYTPALSKLGLQASGLRSEFPLSRAPITGSVTVTLSPASGLAWNHVKCDSNNAPLNVVRFVSPPPAGTKITVSYDVEVKGVKCP
jgi:hypothetical protein